ncbi:MAG: hypothetical protein R3300_03630 [Candidatus Promineifilaceae bacterium]|nr:hypothetical protein [Candidatus Promineifilaceae bacterium]
MTRNRLVAAAGAVGLFSLVALAVFVVLGQRGDGETGEAPALTATLPGLVTVAGGGPAGTPGGQVTRGTLLGAGRPTPADQAAGSDAGGADSAGPAGSSPEATGEPAPTTAPRSSEQPSSSGSGAVAVNPSPTASRSAATATAGPSPTPLVGAQASPTRTAAPTATATRATGSGGGPTATPLGQAATATPSATPSPSPTTAAGPADSISGRLLLNGEPAAPGTLLTLEDAAFELVVETRTEADGRYRFTQVPASSSGYHITFRWDLNQAYSQALVLGWIWIGPVPLAAGQALALPDMDVARQGFGARQPPADSSIAAAEVTAANPLTFSWRVHPQADAYWVDLLRGTALTPVWQSALIEDDSVTFDGRLDDGSRWSPATYFWAVGGRGRVGEYPLVVYGHYNGLRVVP